MCMAVLLEMLPYNLKFVAPQAAGPKSVFMLKRCHVGIAAYTYTLSYLVGFVIRVSMLRKNVP